GRPYLLRNPQLLTALIPSVGALVGLFLLVEGNYFSLREERNRLQELQTQRTKDDADRVVAEAKGKTPRAGTIPTAANEKAQAQVAGAESASREANEKTDAAIARAEAASNQARGVENRLVIASARLDSVNREFNSATLAYQVDEALAMREVARARDVA